MPKAETDAGTGFEWRPMGLNEHDAPDSDLVGLLDESLSAVAHLLGVNSSHLSKSLAQDAPLAQVLKLPRNVADFLYARACRWFSLGQPARAEPLFRSLCLLDPSDADCWVGYGTCLRLRSAFDEALRAFGTAAALRPDWAVPYFHAMELLVRRQEWNAAAKALAMFETRCNGEVEPVMLAEAARYGTAIRMHTAAGPRQKLPILGREGARP